MLTIHLRAKVYKGPAKSAKTVCFLYLNNVPHNNPRKHDTLYRYCKNLGAQGNQWRVLTVNP